jgi:exodeoxyribonuclease-3
VSHRSPPLRRIVSWNINSIRTRVGQVVEWADRHDADVLLLQETKCTDADFPHDRFEAAGYEVAHHGIDHWNGVAIASRVGIGEITRGFAGPQRAPYDEARLIAATCAGVRVWSVYVPNGRELDDPHYLYKLVWLERLRAEVATAIGDGDRAVVAGDFNVAPADIDIYMPSRWRRRTHASTPERAAIDALLDVGLHDVTRQHHPEPGVYTWWNYRPGSLEKDQGLRIDLALCSPAAAAMVDDVWIDREARAAERPSDHAPLVLDLVEPGAAG